MKDKIKISSGTANNRCKLFEDKDEVDEDEDKSVSDVNSEEEITMIGKSTRNNLKEKRETMNGIRLKLSKKEKCANKIIEFDYEEELMKMKILERKLRKGNMMACVEYDKLERKSVYVEMRYEELAENLRMNFVAWCV